MTMRRFLRSVAAITAAALLMLAVGCGNKAEQTDDGHDHDHDTAASSHTHEDGARIIMMVETNNGTYNLTIRHENEVLYHEENLPKAPFKDPINEDVFAITWATSYGVNDYYSIYCDTKNCRISEKFQSPFGTDGYRVALPMGNNEEGYSILVRDIFDAKIYNKSYPLEDAYTGGDGGVIYSGTMQDEDTVRIAYYTAKDGTHRLRDFHLYAE